jgi:hypothetical protein
MGKWGSQKKGSQCWLTRWLRWTKLENVSTRRSCIDSKVGSSYSPQSAVRSPQSKEDSLASSVQSLESEAEECFQKAIAIAQRQQAKSLELRAVMSLSHLWQQQGKNAEARQMLAEIYGWFTEGFDTKDLQEAKALLEELA